MNYDLPKKMILLLISAFSLFSIWATYSVYSSNNIKIYAENGLIENMQAILIACSFLIYLIAALLNKQKITPILIFCSLLCYSFFLRELDVEKMNVPHIFQIIGSGVGRNATILIALVALLGYISFNNFNFHKQLAYKFIRTESGYLLIIAGITLVGSSFFEKQFTFSHHIYFEEIFELLGYLFLLLSAITSLSSKTSLYTTKK